MLANILLGIFCGPHSDKKVRGWTMPPELFMGLTAHSGDYAIVENGDDYSMVKVVGVVYAVEEKYVWSLGGKKNVVKVIPRAEVRAD